MKKRKNVLIGAAVAVGLLLLVGFYTGFGRGNSSQTTENVLENEPTIAPVDSSVVVTIEEAVRQGEIVIEIKNAPEGTKKVEMELTYDRERRPEDETDSDTIPDGLLTECEFKSGQRSCKKDRITLGTCSSGVCRYHTVVGPLKLSAIFMGSYGERILEKEYEL